MSSKAILIGASGLIGSHLLELLLASSDFSEVITFSRSKLPVSDNKLEEHIIDFEELNKYKALIKGDVIFSVLGTTKSKTSNTADYRKIDFEYPVELAKFGLENGVKQFHIVTSLGADDKSSNSYLKMKGELELILKKLNYPSLHIYQPSYLEGVRKDIRISDRIMQPLMKFINPLLKGNLKKYRSIKASEVAKAMINQSVKDLSGTFVYTSNKIKELV
ncbi:NAD(P)H-binding protein [Daejeonella oryzae]|uniref:NAD(P)H-binding protein n=1 Tax=Daejeonella oryzae TaxID=1122943 RepID=UPI000428226B|nr:NAD(P)H-binding protein [Daejeonella oryzae]